MKSVESHQSQSHESSERDTAYIDIDGVILPSYDERDLDPNFMILLPLGSIGLTLAHVRHIEEFLNASKEQLS